MTTIQSASRSGECDEIFALYRSASGTLGFLPRGAFEDGIAKRRVITARQQDGTLLGYLLFRVVQRRASITHLCVDLKVRNMGVAGQLVEELKRQTAHLESITLKCRRDYTANLRWPKWGFVAKGEVQGRGADGEKLVIWHLDQNHADLFSGVADERPLAVIDTNVFFDLFLPDRPNTSRVLVEPWIDETLQLTLTPEVFNDIHRCKDEVTRNASRIQTTAYSSLRTSPETNKRIVPAIAALFGEASMHTEQTKSDIRHLAHTVAAGVKYFITRDQGILEKNLELLNGFDLQVLSPVELVSKLDAIEREREYQPRRISGSGFSSKRVSASDIPKILDQFCHSHERKRGLRAVLEACVATPKECSSSVTTSSQGEAVTLYATRTSDAFECEIILLRTGRDSLAPTIVRHLLMETIVECTKNGVRKIIVTESSLPTATQSALEELGFVLTQRGWLKPVLRGFVSRNAVNDTLKDLQAFGLASTLDLAAEATETIIWPAKVEEDPMPCYLIPIQAQYADHFFETDSTAQRFPGMTCLREDLRLGVEAVYYSASRLKITAPARILWYVSRGKSGLGSMEVKATSRLRQVVRGKPKELFRAFRRLGVYEWEQVFGAAKRSLDNELVALRFSHTECFPQPLDLARLATLGVKGAPASVRPIPSLQFRQIYEQSFPHT